jgi:hypothetical protein
MFGGMGATSGGDEHGQGGRHDPMKAAAMGYEAGKKPMQDRMAQLQQTADEDTSRRQMVMKNNMDLLHQQMAMTHMQHQELDATADSNNKGILADADVYDKGLGTGANDPTLKAVQGRGLTYKEALAKLQGNWSNTLAIVDGTQETRNPQTGQMEVEPTYAVLNPKVSIKMSEQQAAQMATFKPQYQTAHQDSGGNLKMPLANYVSDVHQLNSLNQTEAFFENAKDELGIKNSPDFAAIARKGGQPILDAVKDVENSIAQGGTPIDALNRLAGTGGGAQILKEMGITNAQVATLFNKQQSDATLAKEGAKRKADLMTGAINENNASSILTSTDPDITPARKAEARAWQKDTAGQKGAEAAQKSQAEGKDYESMIKTGVNPITHERLGLDNAPNEAMVDLRTGLPVPTNMLTTTKPDLQERNRADFANSVLRTLDHLEQMQQDGKLPNGPLQGRTVTQLVASGMASKDAQEAANFISFAQSASTGAHVGGRFSVPVLEKMNKLLSLNMNDAQFAGAVDSVRTVMEPYKNGGRLVSVQEYKQMSPDEQKRLRTSQEASGATPANTPSNGGKASKYAQ